MSEGAEKNLEELLEQMDPDNRREFNRIYYGRPDNEKIDLKAASYVAAKKLNVDIQAYRFNAASEQTRPPRIVRVGLIQNAIAVPVDRPIDEQRSAIHQKVKKLMEIAASEGVNIICLQEAWPMPFGLCTQEKTPWLDFAESAESGPSTRFLQVIAAEHGIVIISPILERDEQDVIWNTAVVISDSGRVVGKHRKNHLPIINSSDETMYYEPGNTGHPVFETRFGRIAVNICYGRHHPQNWLMFGLNGAEIVFNPAATVASFGEAFWGTEARNAAVANNYFTCSINRVGTEEFSCKSREKTLSRDFYGSSYITAPDGVRTPGLSRTREGILIAEMDLNVCRQVKDKWGFNTTRRLDLYADLLKKSDDLEYKPQIIK